MADKSTALVLDALSRAVADPAGLPLHGGKSAGLFAATAAAKQAAEQCKQEGYLHVVRTETKGKTSHEICAITAKGLAYLLAQVSPKKVLEDLVRALEARQSATGELLMSARQMQAGLDALKATAEKVLQHVNKAGASCVPPPSPAAANGSETWTGTILSYLTRWQSSGASEDCSVPDLYRQARQASPQLTIGHFHDGLRRLHERRLLHLLPPAAVPGEMAQPEYALFDGGNVLYYVTP